MGERSGNAVNTAGRPHRSDLERTAGGILAQLESVRSAAELERHVGSFCRSIGFDYFSYVLVDRMHLDTETGEKPMLASSYPQPWQERYRRRRYDQLDPVVTVGRRQRRPFFWGETEYLRRLPPSDRQVFNEARDFGIHIGYTMPVHGPHGECGLFSLAVQDDSARCEESAHENRHLLQVLSSEIHTIMVERLGWIARSTPTDLTEQERVCLSWTVRGKTAWEIAQILDRSRPTIDFHLQKAMRKLGASNKIHAAFKALQAGLI